MISERKVVNTTKDCMKWQHLDLEFLRCNITTSGMLLISGNDVLAIKTCLAQSAVEYTDCNSAEGKYPHQRMSWYDTKQSDGEIPVLLEL